MRGCGFGVYACCEPVRSPHRDGPAPLVNRPALPIVRREHGSRIGRVAEPEDIAAVVAFLASARNRFVTGDTIEASGGADRFL
jgi:NAD(P)-dependent dehydrogenase (short-subunit alcohol dehydrogenase family)